MRLLNFREVFKAREKKNAKKFVALKKVLMENEKEGVSFFLLEIKDLYPYHIHVPWQFPITALRELKILQLLKHENVVHLIEICRTKGQRECLVLINF